MRIFMTNPVKFIILKGGRLHLELLFDYVKHKKIKILQYFMLVQECCSHPSVLSLSQFSVSILSSQFSVSVLSLSSKSQFLVSVLSSQFLVLSSQFSVSVYVDPRLLFTSFSSQFSVIFLSS